jgi:spermidine synthase
MTEQDMNPTAGPGGSRRFLPLLLLLFVGSGCAALIYEIVWLQLLQLVIGLTTISMGLLLGNYMGGMCLGSLLLSRLISSSRHPLRVYAMLELGIGVLGIGVLFAVPMVGQLYTAEAVPGLPGMLLRGAVAAVCLLPPTLLMGATLPAIARWVETTPKGVSWLGFFYGGNIAGAVFGCLLAGFYLLRVHDMATATYVAATINATVALLALALSAMTPHRKPAVEAARATLTLVRGDWPVYVTIALSGMCALGAEVVWTRLLSLTLGGTVYTFSLILAVFLVGLGIGSAAGSFLSRSTSRARLALGCCQMLQVLWLAWTAFVIAKSLPYWPIDPSLATSPWFTFQLDLACCFWAILPATILWGASFPLALAALAKPGQDGGRLVGGVYASNTVGAIFGSLGFSIMIIPMMGSQNAQRVLMGLTAVSGLVILLPLLRSAAATSTAGKPGKFNFAATTLAGALVAVMLLAAGVSNPPWGIIAYGRFMGTYGNRLAPKIVKEADVPTGGGEPDIYCVYAGEGLNGSVAVTKDTSGIRSFHSAGKVQASNDPRDMRLQRMLGHLSALSVTNPESVLVVACGAGVTAGTFVLYPDVKHITICDIEPLVPKYVAPMFKVENYDVVNDPRVRVVLDDGRHFIRTSREKFDVITSDPIDPWVKGCAALYTEDYYQMCKEHLKPGGVMTLWIPLYENNTDSVKSIISTFFKVFPHGVLWSNDTGGNGYDAVLFGRAEDTQYDVDKLQARLDSTKYAMVKQSLAEAGFNSANDLLATYVGQPSDLKEWMSGAQINTDRNLRLQYLCGMALNTYMGTEILSGITKYYKFPTNLFVGSEQSLQALRADIETTHKLDSRNDLPADNSPASVAPSSGL